MSAAIDINSTRMRSAQTAYDNLLPEDFERPESPPIDYDAYVDDWVRGNLVDAFNRDIYGEPIERLAEDTWLADLLAAESDEAILAQAKAVREKLRELVCEQADDLNGHTWSTK